MFFSFSLILYSILRVSHILINVNIIIDVNIYEVRLGILGVDLGKKKPIVTTSYTAYYTALSVLCALSAGCRVTPGAQNVHPPAFHNVLAHRRGSQLPAS